ncbi:recombinase family protein [Prosthecomicrobium hirschii]|uniref:recombinase family protein n=1 Tax=Prosthecodimorpha hirschii TaxID=665126 RepID=UPI0009FB7297|nr:recombinase family protein [Prosthecomicrobium hirschii]
MARAKTVRTAIEPASGPAYEQDGRAPRRLRCAIYTRKSSEEGLEQEFNSLDAQREACEAYVASQRAEGWVLHPAFYDDGGFSGGTLERPGLRRLIADIETGLVDIVVVYKIDRLSRSLMDFAKLVEAFDRNAVTFVSVTQSFNTTTSMGRLTLNILLSFAQFEREVTAERIRDKVRASRQKGIWMGGWAPLGYHVKDRKLIVQETEAELVRRIFRRFLETGSVTVLTRELHAEGRLTQHGKPFHKGLVYRLLINRVYLGEAVHKGRSYPGEHAAIIDAETFDHAASIMATQRRTRAAETRRATPAPLKGLLFGPNGAAMTPTHTKKGDRFYRYYVSTDVLKERGRPSSAAPTRLPAAQVEALVVDQLRALVRDPALAGRVSEELKASHPKLKLADIDAQLRSFDAMWDQIFPAEQARILHLLIQRVDFRGDRIDVTWRGHGFSSLVRDLVAGNNRAKVAA